MTKAQRAPRKWGPWLFAATVVIFWLLLALSGRGYFKKLEQADQRYAVKAAQLEGVTRLRIEGDGGDAQGYWPATRVLLGGAPEVELSIRMRPADRDGKAASGQPGGQPPLSAVREGDTLVLRWTTPRRENAGPPGRPEAWMNEIVLPAQFQELALSHAAVEARTAVERLQVSGRSVTVEGPVAHLDLRSARCAPCAAQQATAGDEACPPGPDRARRSREASLEVTARGMQTVRIGAGAGEVTLRDSEGLQRLELRLAPAVALSVDRAGALGLGAAGGGHDFTVAGPGEGACGLAAMDGRETAPSKPLDLVPVP